MVAKRIIPCLDVKNGRTVKGVRFENLRDVGDPISLALRYVEEGADELVLLDVSATLEGRKAMIDTVHEVAKVLTIPFTVGGGIGSYDDGARMLDAGADKISINSAALQNPACINELASAFGSQFVVVAVDSKMQEGVRRVFSRSGTVDSGRLVSEWIREATERGAGEILLTSMDHDGTGAGFDLEGLQAIAPSSRIPIIASGGAGTTEHFVDVFIGAQADAALAAGIFHDRLLSIREVKDELLRSSIEVRI